MKRFIDVHIPISACNLRCHYCYVGQLDQRDTEKVAFRYSDERVGEALSRERLGGLCHFNLCGIGETLLPRRVVGITRALLEQGHYVMIVTNGTLGKRFEEFAGFPKGLRSRLGFKFSFHYLEFRERGLMDAFFGNVRFVKDHGMSFSVELTPSDELEPFIDDIKAICMENLGALCHVTIPRDMREQGLTLLSRRPFEEFCDIWSTFDSPMFDFKRSVWGQRRREFCYAGMWSGLLNIGTGVLTSCYAGGFSQNIFDNPNAPIKWVAVGRHCGLPHCYNSHSLLGLGDIPDIGGCTYAEERDRIDVRDGSHWLRPEMREFLSCRLVEANAELTDVEKSRNEWTRRLEIARSLCSRAAVRMGRMMRG